MNTLNEKSGNDANAIHANGSCHCGKTEYTVNGQIQRQSYCNCKACQKATGALKVPFITVHKDSVNVNTSNLSIVHGNTDGRCDNHGTWQFCNDCGTKIFWIPNKGDQVDILVGTLEDTSVFHPKE